MLCAHLVWYAGSAMASSTCCSMAGMSTRLYLDFHAGEYRSASPNLVCASMTAGQPHPVPVLRFDKLRLRGACVTFFAHCWMQQVSCRQRKKGEIVPHQMHIELASDVCAITIDLDDILVGVETTPARGAQTLGSSPPNTCALWWPSLQTLTSAGRPPTLRPRVILTTRDAV